MSLSSFSPRATGTMPSLGKLSDRRRCENHSDAAASTLYPPSASAPSLAEDAGKGKGKGKSNDLLKSQSATPYRDFPIEDYEDRGHAHNRKDMGGPQHGPSRQLPRLPQHYYVLPVLLLEFLAISLTRAVLPAILLQAYGGGRVYLVLGFADCVRGLLAFGACPAFGKLSDVIGRRLCLLVTVAGTCAPVCSLALFGWEDSYMLHHHRGHRRNGTIPTTDSDGIAMLSNATGVAEQVAAESEVYYPLPPNAVTVFVVLLALSGVFSSTFTLVFAYISDTVRKRDERVSAYGLALATFGLSFTIGPMAGGYLAESQSNPSYVFMCSFVLAVLDVLYIYFVLPESIQTTKTMSGDASIVSSFSDFYQDVMESSFSLWSPMESLRLLVVDPFLRHVGQVAFLYYTGLWAVLSTLSLYAVQHFHYTPERLGELMSMLGLCTMVSEAVLVRVLVPLWGEQRSMKMGLLSFAIQCALLGFATEGWQLFICALLSLIGNLVYPSLSSLVSGSVAPHMVGEALGAINGVKALTEGIGPLLFGSLMTVSEKTALPGAPYLLASALVLAAYRVATRLPDAERDDFIHELEFKKQSETVSCADSNRTIYFDSDREDEYQGLLSEIEESESDI